MVERITQQPEPDMSPVHQVFPAPEQVDFGQRLIHSLGFDPQRARQDKSAHPFMTKLSLGDIRTTTRVKEHDLTEALFSTLHETGHALYELGIDPTFEGGPLAAASSSAVHESQSRLWENLVGRSLPFWEHTFPQLQAAFPDQLGETNLEAFYRAINRVERSLIRTDADEVTYNLHVMIRFDLELDLLEGRLEVRHLPDAWRSRYQQDLGIEPSDDKDGVLQDVHWYSGRIGGGFQSYTLGNIMSAQFMQAAKAAIPTIDDDLRRGDVSGLSQWLVEHVHRHGRKFTPEELVERATGRPLELEPYTTYLRDKFEALYPA
jgi:carboxypeptidase Taq